MRSTSSSWLMPSSAPASTVWMRPSVPAIRCTSARVSSTETAPAELSAVPNRTVPTSVYSLRPSWVTIVIGIADLEAGVVGGRDVEGHLVVGFGPSTRRRPRRA